MTFEVFLSRALGEGDAPVTVDYHLAPFTGTSPVTDPAEASDYTTEVRGTLTFTPDDPEKSVIQKLDIEIKEDEIDEDEETLQLTLSNPVNATLSGANENAATGTIHDNDSEPVLELEDGEITEGGLMSFKVTLSKRTEREVTVTLAASADDDDDTVDATSGTDYTDPAGTITLEITSAEPMQSMVTVETLDESPATYEGPEVFLLELAASTNSALGTNKEAVGTILDDENPPSVSMVIDNTGQGGDGTWDEGDIVVFNVTLASTPTSALDAKVEYEVGMNSGDSADPSDFTVVPASPLTLTAAVAGTAVTLTVTIVDDNEGELAETFTVELKSPTHATLNLSQAKRTITISEDNDPALLTLQERAQGD